MLIGRKKEKEQLLSALHSEQSEFIAVYGRRRVGKTYLIREAYDYHFAFQHTGLANSNMQKQLKNFKASLQKVGMKKIPRITCWLDAFFALEQWLETCQEGRKIIFLDELPWMDTPRSDFVSALEHFWNGWATTRKDIVLIVCGSATSWIIEKIINNHGGLHNRLTKRILLQPFTLKECEEFAQSHTLGMSRMQMMEAYMIMGGIPYYWNFLQKGQSLAQNIDRLFFNKEGELKDEFDMLYASLFKSPENYIKVITALGEKKAGMTREEIISQTSMSDSGTLTKILKELEWCGFIRKYNVLGKKVKSAIYQLIDNYTLFYFRFIKQNENNDENFWSSSINSSLYHNWCGLSFERICLLHIPQIKQKLGIQGILSNTYSWSAKSNEELGLPGVQIDMLIDRSDQVVNLCEMKYATSSYSLTKDEEMKLRNRLEVFRTTTQTTKAIHLTMITTYGLTPNIHSGIIQNEVTMDDLFL